MNKFKKIYKYLFWVTVPSILIAIIYIISVLVYAKIYEFKPLPVEVLSNIRGCITSDTLSIDDDYTLLSWNIGYGCMGAQSDFFYDGGSMMRPTEQYYNNCFDSIKSEIKAIDADFLFLQEVDLYARRSYYNNQIESIGKYMSDYNGYFANNYNVKFIPLPIFNPTGVVQAGLLSMSKFSAINAERIDLETSFPFPENLFILKRCMLICRFTISNGRELVLINIHNSAFDEGGKVRDKESRLVSSFAMNEYEKGNYVVIGGDWNMNPSNYNAFNISNGDNAVFDVTISDSIYLNNDWDVIFDKGIPTNRSAYAAYQHGITPTTTYDFFITSPNIEILKENTIDRRFVFSDHNMVIIKFRLI